MFASFESRYDCCPLCGSGSITLEFKRQALGTQLTWDRCRACTLVFQNPSLTAASIQAGFEQSDYFGLRGAGALSAYSDYLAHDPIRIRQSRRRLVAIKKATGVSSGRLLDIGSASGFFGVAAREAGFDVTCIEPAAGMAALGQSQYGLRFQVCTLEAADLSPASFDVATLWGSDSALAHPLHSFELIARTIRPGGVFAMNYQNFDHWIRRLFPQLKTGWNAIFNHTRQSLELTLKRVGFDIIDHRTEFQTVPLDHLGRLFRVPVPAHLAGCALMLPAISYRRIISRRAPWCD